MVPWRWHLLPWCFDEWEEEGDGRCVVVVVAYRDVENMAGPVVAVEEAPAAAAGIVDIPVGAVAVD